uniref:Uncharacterized protein n=1 Tax=Plectus sambesii TaxID=2011161 RepID=A0A914UMV7_9BILA
MFGSPTFMSSFAFSSRLYLSLFSFLGVGGTWHMTEIFTYSIFVLNSFSDTILTGVVREEIQTTRTNELSQTASETFILVTLSLLLMQIRRNGFDLCPTTYVTSCKEGGQDLAPVLSLK